MSSRVSPYFEEAERQVSAMSEKLAIYAALLESLGYQCHNAERNGYLEKPIRKESS